MKKRYPGNWDASLYAQTGVFCVAVLYVGGTPYVDYRLAPQYPYPVAVLESWDIALWAKEHARELGANPEKMILIGHSSGGNLITGICMRGGTTGLLKPLCAIIDCAPMDLATDPAEKERSICDMPAEQAKISV